MIPNRDYLPDRPQWPTRPAFHIMGTMPPDLAHAEALIDFWFGPPSSPERMRPRAVWFEPEGAFDAALRQRFLADHERAAAGALAAWQAVPESCLALVLLLDQLPRNLFRGTPRAFATDPLARQAARQAIDAGFDRGLPPVWRWFFYLPFEHAEDLADQALSLALHASLPEDGDKAEVLRYARGHYDIIARFGRFPHRNRILGRASTPEEDAFLRGPGSAF
jgi:uncharacterized protein (DUF924 family)